ncbi:LysR substrate-binding domain-containing protein [Falsiroseomonas sp.]|uniref:LysR substrate-binding domain-containing protein n=1 Tax=Falsiroseomonas sp. TaxID=2870721 RepID=UPI003F6E695D
MQRDLLPHLPVVLAVARCGGFAAAGAALGLGASAVSHAVRLVEDRLGLPLFARTTRSLALTEAGAELVSALGPAFAEIEEALERLRAARGEVSGTLRINAPSLALPLALNGILAEMARRHPGVTVEVVTDNALTDIVAGGFDAGIRLGEFIAQDMVAVRLTPPFRAVMVASPAYLAARGTPDSVAALARHACIGFRLIASGAVYDWELSEGGREVAVPVRGPVRVTDPMAARDLAIAGLGIAYLFEPLVQAELAEDRLRLVMPEAAIEEPGLFLYHPMRAAAAPKLAALLAVIRARRP